MYKLQYYDFLCIYSKNKQGYKDLTECSFSKHKKHSLLSLRNNFLAEGSDILKHDCFCDKKSHGFLCKFFAALLQSRTRMVFLKSIIKRTFNSDRSIFASGSSFKISSISLLSHFSAVFLLQVALTKSLSRNINI